MLLVFVDRRQVDRAQALDPCVDTFEFLFGLLFIGLFAQRGEHPVQVITIFMQLLLQGLAPHAKTLPFHAVLFELPA
ncbi:hypothetical protein D3C76_1043580 [compost metagenome]